MARLSPQDQLAALKAATKDVPYDTCWDVAPEDTKQRVDGPVLARMFEPEDLADLNGDEPTCDLIGERLRAGMVVVLGNGVYRWLQKKAPEMTQDPTRRFVAYDRGVGEPVDFAAAKWRIWKVVAT